MAHENKQKKSLLYRLSWNNNGKNLNNNIAEMSELGQKCIDVWIAGSDNDGYGKKILQNFENIDRSLLDMQDCIINVLKPSSLAHKIIHDRIEFKYKLTDCNCNTKIFKLKERIATEREKCQMLLKETTILTQEKQNLIKENEGLEEIFRNKEEALKRQNNILIENLKQQLCDGDEELERLRFLTRTELGNLKHGLGIVNRENYTLRQRLLQIPVLEQSFDQQRQKFILQIRACQAKIKDLENNLKYHQQDLCTVNEENRNLTHDILQISHSGYNDFILKQIEYQKSINTLEESVAYFVRQNDKLRHENCQLRLKIDVNSLETSISKYESTANGEMLSELEEPYNNNYVEQHFKTIQQINKSEDTPLEESGGNAPPEEHHKRSLGNKEEVPDNTNVNEPSSRRSHQTISKNGSILTKENCESLTSDDPKEHFLKPLFTEHNRKPMGDKEVAD